MVLEAMSCTKSNRQWTPRMTLGRVNGFPQLLKNLEDFIETKMSNTYENTDEGKNYKGKRSHVKQTEIQYDFEMVMESKKKKNKENPLDLITCSSGPLGFITLDQ